MKRKKTFGVFLGGLGVCALLAFSFILVPGAMAAAPLTSDIQTVSGGAGAPPEGLPETLSAAEPEDTINAEGIPDLNAISGERALEYAVAALVTHDANFGVHSESDYNALPAKLTYLAETAPANGPIWIVSLREDHAPFWQDRLALARELAGSGKFPDSSLDEILQMLEQDEAVFAKFKSEAEYPKYIFRVFDGYSLYYVVQINALTGEYICANAIGVELGEALDSDEALWYAEHVGDPGFLKPAQ